MVTPGCVKPTLHNFAEVRIVAITLKTQASRVDFAVKEVNACLYEIFKCVNFNWFSVSWTFLTTIYDVKTTKDEREGITVIVYPCDIIILLCRKTLRRAERDVSQSLWSSSVSAWFRLHGYSVSIMCIYLRYLIGTSGISIRSWVVEILTGRVTYL